MLIGERVGKMDESCSAAAAFRGIFIYRNMRAAHWLADYVYPRVIWCVTRSPLDRNVPGYEARWSETGYTRPEVKRNAEIKMDGFRRKAICAGS